ncbi:hypothetical protein [Thiohalobacter thiocyanaticus]|uniref:hypothetical protein n=1 Tax=Thiohalobacter thiocyanaticus TaxID=585455 RepID=UPI001F4EA427|nr:hypothetical protein [Thiohalobacter thiocyanaticus]
MNKYDANETYATYPARIWLLLLLSVLVLAIGYAGTFENMLSLWNKSEEYGICISDSGYNPDSSFGSGVSKSRKPASKVPMQGWFWLRQVVRFCFWACWQQPTPWLNILLL